MNKNPLILLHPNIPPPLHGLNPRTILGNEWWNTQRQKAYAKNNYHCWACGIHKSQAKYHQWLEAHECYKFDYQNGSAEMIEITALCHSCHNFIHSGRLFVLAQNGQISIGKHDDILSHGKLILQSIDTSNNPYIANRDDNPASWSKWHLILNGKKYYTKFKNYNEFTKHYRDK